MSNPQFIVDEMPWIVRAVVIWVTGKPLISALLILVLLDWMSGICRACITKTLSSTISWRGMVRKVFMLLLIGVCATLQPFAGGLPLTELAALAFIVVETLSIVENAAVSGVPIPRALTDVLTKLREQANERRLPEIPPVETHADVHVNFPPGSSPTVEVHSGETSKVIQNKQSPPTS
jgi:toxin secretion/phage lysis holin